MAISQSLSSFCLFSPCAFHCAVCDCLCSMDGGELFSRIQDRGDQAFTERGTAVRCCLLRPCSHLPKRSLALQVSIYDSISSTHLNFRLFQVK